MGTSSKTENFVISLRKRKGYINFLNAQHSTEDFVTARDYLRSNLKTAEELRDRSGPRMARTAYGNLCTAHHCLEDFDSAIDYYEYIVRNGVASRDHRKISQYLLFLLSCCFVFVVLLFCFLLNNTAMLAPFVGGLVLGFFFFRSLRLLTLRDLRRLPIILLLLLFNRGGHRKTKKSIIFYEDERKGKIDVYN